MAKKTPPQKPLKEARLSPKQEMFCREYLIDLNATQAAIRAGYSPKTAGVQAEALLKKPDIGKYVDELKKARAVKVQVNSEDVLRELVKLANSDVREVFNEDGSLKPMSEWPDVIARCVSSVEVEELFEMQPKDGGRGMEKVQIGWTKKVKFWDKTKALDMLGRHLKLFSGDDTNKGPAVIVIDKTGSALDGIR